MSNHPHPVNPLNEAPGDEEATPFRLRELKISEALMRELEAKRLGMTLTEFRLAIRDVDASGFAWSAEFVPPLRAESADPMSPAEWLGCEVTDFLARLIEKAKRAGEGEEPTR
ncbi:MAG: hypothetical protein LBU23_02765 [Planctomycetota bacterium]|jgi:hypothetical protein|nr:hypothetical protein [Planctomycetota bacterium]